MDKRKNEIYHENKVHTPSDFPYNTYLCTIPLDFRAVKPHWHDEAEIIVIKKGSGIVTVDLVPFTVTAGDIVFVFPQQLHSIEQKDNLTMEYENILFRTALLKSAGYDLCSDSFLQPIFSGKVRVGPIVRTDKLSELIEDTDRLQSEQPYGYQLAVKANLLRIMYELNAQSVKSDSKPVNKKALENMKTVLTYISENYRNHITIDEISGKCFYSKSCFMKFFKEATGVSFIQYLNDYRLDIAAGLLLENDENVLNIASDTGFDNLSYFNRSFKKKYGVTPARYRKQMSYTAKE